MAREFEIVTPTKFKEDRHSWANTAFLIETLVLLAFLAASIAIIAQLFAYSVSTAKGAKDLSNAAIVAQNAAEEFSSNPAAVSAGTKVGQGVAAYGTENYNVQVEISEKSETNGTLFTALITVTPRNDESGKNEYKLTTTRYLSNGASANAPTPEPEKSDDEDDNSENSEGGESE